jgi:hypothetical protein
MVNLPWALEEIMFDSEGDDQNCKRYNGGCGPATGDGRRRLNHQ